MTRRLNYSARFPLRTTKEVYALLSDRAYWDARMEEMRKYSPNEVVSLDAGDSGVTVVLEQVLPRVMLPDLAQSILRRDMVITRREVYGPFGPEVFGEYVAEIPAGPPGGLGGSMHLFATDTGCTLRITNIATVQIPFLGARLEQLMLVSLVDLLRAEAEFTKQWLDEHNPLS